MTRNAVTIDVDIDSAAPIEDDTLVLDNFRERDSHVLALVRDADDIDGVVHGCLVVGARALAAAQTTMDVAVVEKAFGDMSSTFSRGLESFAGELDAKTKELLDGDEGSLPRSFEEFRTELEKLLDGTFDPDSKLSAITKIQDVMRLVAAEQVKAVRRLIDPDDEESPLGRYRNEIVKSVQDETERVHKAVKELTVQIAVGEKEAEMFELTTKKGFTFEDHLEQALISICQPLGDVAERVGGAAGARGKKGDFKVTVNPEDTWGKDICFAIEAKNQQVNLRDILRELDAAIVNRTALAGIAVFAKDEQCPGDPPFQPYGTRALVVYDPTTGDDLALRLACSWARWITRRQLTTGGETVDLGRVGSLIDDAQTALRTRATIDRALTTSANKITEAQNHLGTLVAEVEAALAAIQGEITE